MWRPATVFVLAIVGFGCAPPEPEAKESPTAQSKVKVRPSWGFRKRGGGSKDAQEAVLKVLKGEAEAYAQATAGVEPQAGPAALTKAVGEYARRLGGVDAGAAPEPVAKAFEAYRRAVRELHESIRRLPTSEFPGPRLHDLLVGVVTDKGRPPPDVRARLGGGATDALENMARYLADLYRQADEHGFDIELDGVRYARPG